MKPDPSVPTPRLRRRARSISALALTTGWLLLAGTAPAGARQDQAQLDAEFARTMAGARLVGKFTVSTPQGERAPQDDSYSVSELQRGEGGTWIFHYTMSYGGGNQMTVPIPVRVLWAGDTPVLTMSDQKVEGLGEFSVRVLLYQDRYAGTWSHGPIGGHMWGRIEHPAENGAAQP